MNRPEPNIDADYEAPLDLPCNVQAEQSLLGAILLNNDAYALVSGFLDADHFFFSPHQEIYEAMGGLIANDRIASPITLRDVLPNVEVDEGVSLQQYLARLSASATTVLNSPDFGRAIHDLAQRRSQIEIAGKLTESAYSATGAISPDQNAEEAISDLEALLSAGTGRHRIESGMVGSLAGKLIESLDSDVPLGIPWGLTSLDRITNGACPKELILIAGRPSMGKTHVASSLALNMAKRGHGVLFLSLEMSREQLIARMFTDMVFSRGSPISYNKILSRSLDMIERERIEGCQTDFENLPLDIAATSAPTVERLRALVRRKFKEFKRRGHTLELVIVDYLGLMMPSGRYAGQKVNEVGEISFGLKGLAIDFNIPVMALSQLSRQLEQRDSKRPMLSDLRNSGDIEQDADTVIFVYRDHYYLKRKTDGKKVNSPEDLERLIDCENEMDLIVAKQRNGPTQTATVYADMAAGAVRNQ